MKAGLNEKLTQIGVLIVAISAVAISVWQGQLMKRHNELTVRPYFNFTRSTHGESNTFELQLANQGYGPAIFEDYYLIYQGKRYNDWMPILNDKNAEGTLQFSLYKKGDVFAAGQRTTILKLNNFKSEEDIQIVIHYKSIYEEEFEISAKF